MLIELPTFTSKRATVDLATTRLVDKLRAGKWTDQEKPDELIKTEVSLPRTCMYLQLELVCLQLSYVRLC